jgi:hypothetical protein
MGWSNPYDAQHPYYGLVAQTCPPSNGNLRTVSQVSVETIKMRPGSVTVNGRDQHGVTATFSLPSEGII